MRKKCNRNIHFYCLTETKLYSSNVNCDKCTAWKLCKYGVFSGPYFPIFGLNTGKYGPETVPY